MKSSLSTIHSVSRQLVGAEVLIVDRDESVRSGMNQLLSDGGLHVTGVDDPSQAWELLDKKFFSVVIVDLDTPEPNAGLETASTMQVASPTSMVIMLTPRKSYDDAVAAIRAGAVDVILKSPEAVPYLKERVMQAAARSVDKREVASVLTDVRDVQDEFLKLFMEAERRAVDLQDRLAGRDPKVKPSQEIHVLVVSGNPDVAKQLADKAGAGYVFESAVAGGQALDLISSSHFHIALVENQLSDLPSSMVVRSISAQSADTLVLTFTGPGPGGHVDLVQSSGTIPVIPEFSEIDQLESRLEELGKAFRARERERRYTQDFREKHYDFIRKYVDLKTKIDKALT